MLNCRLRLVLNESFRRNSTFAENLQKDARNLELIYIDWFLAEISLRSHVRKRALTDVLPKHGKTGDRSNQLRGYTRDLLQALNSPSDACPVKDKHTRLAQSIGRCDFTVIHRI